MIALNFIDPSDGCELSEQELLSMARAGFPDGPLATAEELAEELKKLPVEGRTPPVPTDRGLLALAQYRLPKQS